MDSLSLVSTPVRIRWTIPLIADIAVAKDGNNFGLINYTDTIFQKQEAKGVEAEF
jgi:hypothetical protein